MRNKRKAYIAGPMRSKPKFNYPAFYAAEEQLRAAGWTVYNPAELDKKEDGIDYSKIYKTKKERHRMAGDFENARRFARRDLGIITKKLKAENGDAIVVLNDWEESIGANAEVAAGIWVGLQILTLEEALEERINDGKAGHATNN